MNEQWTLSLEGRWNTDTQTIVYDGVSVLQNPNDPGAIVDAEQEYSAFMPRLIISWQPTENTNLYAHFSKSNLQGIDTNAGDYTERTGIPLDLGFFTPKQTLDAIEVGLKQRVGGWLNYAVAAFAMDWDNQTFFELSPAPFFTAANLFGDAEIRGMEVEFEATPNEWFIFSGGVAYNSVEFARLRRRRLGGFGRSRAHAVARPAGLGGRQPAPLHAGMDRQPVGNRPAWPDGRSRQQRLAAPGRDLHGASSTSTTSNGTPSRDTEVQCQGACRDRRVLVGRGVTAPT